MQPLAWETMRATKGNSSANKGFPVIVCGGKEELEQVALHALGKEKPLCAMHIMGIVCWPLALTPGLPCSAAKVSGSLSHRSRKSCLRLCHLLLFSNILQIGLAP